MRAAPLAELLDSTPELFTLDDLPVGHVEAHRLFDVAGDARQALDTLQDTIARECFGNPDRLGLCGQCGKVVDRSGRSGHDPGGCMSIIAEPVVALARMPKRLYLRARWHWRERGGRK